MNVLAALALFFVTSSPPPPAARTVRRIELKGEARIFATDVPVRKGRLYLFHRYPDGVYMSVPAEDVLRISATTVEDKGAPTDFVLLGPTGEGIPSEPVAAAASAPPQPTYDDWYPGDYGYYGGGCYGCFVPPIHPPRPPGPRPQPLVGPNGFPLMPGMPPPNPIGPNGFPILSPPAPIPIPSPR